MKRALKSHCLSPTCDIDDAAESLGETAAGDAATLQNARSPQLNLECLYGDGPVDHRCLYQRNDPAKFLLGVHGTDVQRNSQGIAIDNRLVQRGDRYFYRDFTGRSRVCRLDYGPMVHRNKAADDIGSTSAGYRRSPMVLRSR